MAVHLIDPQRSRVSFYNGRAKIAASLAGGRDVYAMAQELHMELVRRPTDIRRDVYIYPHEVRAANVHATSLEGRGFRVLTYGRLVLEYDRLMARGGSVFPIFLITPRPVCIEEVQRRIRF